MKLVLSKAAVREFEKAFGRKDYSRLHKKRITDKNGHQRDVWVKNEEKPKGKPRGGGEANVFGHNYSEFSHKGKAAIEKLITEKNGYVSAAFSREDIGDIDVVWGKITDSKKHKGYGLAHILDKHPNVTPEIIESVIKNGKARNTFNGHSIEFGRYVVGINRGFQQDGKTVTQNNWIVTSFEKKELAGNSARAHAGNLTSGTVSPQNLLDKPSISPSGAAVKGKALSVGDRVSFSKDGRMLSGEVVAAGAAGVTVRGEGSAKGVMYQVPHGDVKNVQKLKNPAFIKGGWRGTDGYQPESCDTIAGLMKTVEAVRNEFSELSEGVKKHFASLNPLLLKRSSLKKEKRVKEKLREDEKILAENGVVGTCYDEKTDTYHCRTIRDCDGHTLCLNSLEDVERVAAYYDKQSYVARIKNNFAKPSPVGYSDINMNIKLSNGAIVEMQLNTTANMVAKERYGHSLYEVYRSVESNPQYKELADLMGEAQKALYGLSNKYSQEGNYPTQEIPGGDIFAEEYKHEPYAAAIRGFVDKAKPLYDKAKRAGALNEDTVKHFDHLVEYIR